MQIAVLGCGAIGGLFLSNLSHAKEDALGVVRGYQKEPLERDGFFIEADGKYLKAKVKAKTSLKQPVDLAVFAVKTNNLEEIIKENIKYLKNAIVLPTQNGIRADYILAKYFSEEKIISSIVMFGATFYPPNKIVRNFDGDLILGNIFRKNIAGLGKVKEILSKSFNTKISKNIKGAKYLKLFINLNNCLPALLGKSMQEVFSDLDLAKLAINLNKEAYKIANRAGINLESLPTYPKERIENLVSLPLDKSAAIFSKVMVNLSKEPLYGSILQSIQRNKPSEIDYINGEIVKLAKENNFRAPLNKKIVELVHNVEQGGFLSKEELLSQTEGVENGE